MEVSCQGHRSRFGRLVVGILKKFLKGWAEYWPHCRMVGGQSEEENP